MLIKNEIEHGRLIFEGLELVGGFSISAFEVIEKMGINSFLCIVLFFFRLVGCLFTLC